MRRGRYSWLVIFAVVLSFCFVSAQNSKAAEKVFKLGVVGPFTGPSAQTGAEFRGSVKMAMEKIHYKIGDYKIELVWIDSQSDPAKATSAYAEAAERDHIQASILNWHSSVAVALMDVCAQYKVPEFFGFGATGVVNKKWRSDPKKYDYWGGKGWPEPKKLVKGYVQCLNYYVKQGIFKPKEKTVALFDEDTDWGRSAGAALKKDFEATGWKVLSEDYFPLTQTDFYTVLSQYKREHVAVIAGSSTAPPFITSIVKQAHEIGLKSVIVADGLGWVGDWYKMTGPASNYVLDMIPQLTTKQSQAWAKAYQKQVGFAPSPSSAGLAYDGTNFFIKIARAALKEYGKLDRETIHKTMVNQVDTGKLTYGIKDGALIMKEYKYTSQSMPDPVVGPDEYFFPVIQYMNGKGSIIYPAEFKQRNLEVKK